MFRKAIFSKIRFLQKVFSLSVLLGLYMLVSGCSILETKAQTEMLRDLAFITGKVSVNTEQTGQRYVVLYKKNEGLAEIVNRYALTDNGQFKISVLPDTYFIGAYIDVNSNETYDNDEPATYFGIEGATPKDITVSAQETYAVNALSITGPITGPNIQQKMNVRLSEENIGRVISLDDPMFLPENVTTGMWRPIDYLDQFGGGLMMLQDYDASKIPVVFVHGILGSSLNFSEMIDSVDRTKFQPWVLQYPSGLALDVVSDYFIRAMTEIQSETNFKEAIVIAHSMGGLMTRSYVMKHQTSEDHYQLKMVMTINSPLYGMDSAAMGVKTSPIIVPAWKDVATGSDYIQRVHAWQWPKEIPYYLLFSYLPDEADDGVVPITSQLSLSLQDEAIKVVGFEGQHAEILHQPVMVERVMAILNNYAQK